MDGNRVFINESIEGSEKKFNVFIDGVEIKGIRELEYISAWDCVPTIKLEFTPMVVDIVVE